MENVHTTTENSEIKSSNGALNELCLIAGSLTGVKNKTDIIKYIMGHNIRKPLLLSTPMRINIFKISCIVSATSL